MGRSWPRTRPLTRHDAAPGPGCGEHEQPPVGPEECDNAVVLALAGLAGAACWAYAASRGLLRPGVSADEYRLGLLRGLTAPVVFLVSLLALPVVGTSATELLWLMVFPAQWLATMWVRHSPTPVESDV